MTKLTINFHQRMGLWLRLGSAQVPSLREASVLIRIMERIRPIEPELKEVKYKQEGGQISYLLPEPTYGTMYYDFENDETEQLIECLNNHKQPFRIDEAAWMLALIKDLEEQLNVEPVQK